MIKTLIRVESSMVYAIGYCSEEKSLEVVFTKGKIWRYEDVPEDVYEEFINSTSLGSYMRNHILDCYREYSID